MKILAAVAVVGILGLGLLAATGKTTSGVTCSVTTTVSPTTQTVAFAAEGLKPSTPYTIELTAPGAVFVEVLTASSSGTIQTSASSWPPTNPWTLDVWANKQGVVGKGSPVCTATI